MVYWLVNGLLLLRLSGVEYINGSQVITLCLLPYGISSVFGCHLSVDLAGRGSAHLNGSRVFIYPLCSNVLLVFRVVICRVFGWVGVRRTWAVAAFLFPAIPLKRYLCVWLSTVCCFSVGVWLRRT